MSHPCFHVLFHCLGIPQTPNIKRGISNAPQQVTLTVSTAESGIEPSNSFFEFVVLVKDENVTIPEFLVPIDYTGLKDNEIVDIRVSSEQLLAEEMYIFQVQARNAFGTTPFSNSLSVRVTTQNTEEQALPSELNTVILEISTQFKKNETFFNKCEMQSVHQ